MKTAIIALSIALMFTATSLAKDLTALSAGEAAEHRLGVETDPRRDADQGAKIYRDPWRGVCAA